MNRGPGARTVVAWPSTSSSTPCCRPSGWRCCSARRCSPLLITGAPRGIGRSRSTPVGQVAVTQALLPALRASRGRIVFISSVLDAVVARMVGIR
jgi:hypothetical protein